MNNAQADKELRGFILTVGVVSNHGNWFTLENPNKELRVLSQAYDWLIFLTDAGLAQFIDKLLLHPHRSWRQPEKLSWQATGVHRETISLRRSLAMPPMTTLADILQP